MENFKRFVEKDEVRLVRKMKTNRRDNKIQGAGLSKEHFHDISKSVDGKKKENWQYFYRSGKMSGTENY